jgi:hypothetical protein
VGESSLVVTLEAPTLSDVTDVRVEVTPVFDSTCPPTTANLPCSRFTVPLLKRGHRLTVDAASRTVRRYDATLKAEVSGFPDVEFDGAFPWPDVAPCSEACVCVTLEGAGPVDVTVEEVTREL